jgi:hypothetical protein
MRRKFILITSLVLILGLEHVSAAKINFSGTWVMDRSRSIGQPPNSEQTMVITQTDEELRLEVNITSPQGVRTIKDTYTLDGKEAEFTPQVPPGAPAAKGKRTVTWLPRGNGIVVTEVSIAETPNGPVTTQITRKWTLSPDGQTLTIDMYIDNPNGSFETRRIFLKK